MRRARKPYAPEGRGVQTSQDCHAEKGGAVLPAASRFSRSLHHFETTRGVNREQPDFGQAGSGGNRPGHSIRDIVKLQVEEYPKTEGRKPFNGARPLRRKELTADLEKAGHATKLARQGAGRPQAVNIQGDDQL